MHATCMFRQNTRIAYYVTTMAVRQWINKKLVSFNSTDNWFLKSVFENQIIHFHLVESNRKNIPFSIIEKLLLNHVFGAIFVPRCTFVVPESKSRVQVQVYTSVTYGYKDRFVSTGGLFQAKSKLKLNDT